MMITSPVYCVVLMIAIVMFVLEDTTIISFATWINAVLVELILRAVLALAFLVLYY